MVLTQSRSIKGAGSGFQEDHFFWSDLDFTFVPEPDVLVPVGEPFPVYFDQVFLAEAAQFPPLHFEIEHDDCVLPGNRPVGQLQVYFVVLVFLADVAALLIATDKEDGAGDVLLPSGTAQHCVAEFGEVAHVYCFGAGVSFCPTGFLLEGLLTDDLLFALDQFQNLPADFAPIFVIAFEVGAYVGDDFGGFVLFDESNDGEDVQNLGDEVLQVQVFLLVHEVLNYLLDAALGHHVLLVDQTVEYLRQQLPAQQLGPQRHQLPIQKGLLVAHVPLEPHAVLVLLQFADHSSEANVDEVVLGDPHDEAEGVKVEDDVEGPPLVFEDADAFVEQLAKLKDGVFIVVHVLDEALDEGADFLPRRYGSLVHPTNLYKLNQNPINHYPN